MKWQQKHKELHYYELLSSVKNQIASLQEDVAEIEDLKAGKTWRDKGEKFAGYLKRTATVWESQRSIQTLIDPVFIQELLSSIPTDLRLDDGDRSLLVAEIDFEDITDVLKKAPKRSSPSSDGLPFEILNLMIRFSAYKELLLTVFNAALAQAIFPNSWN